MVLYAFFFFPAGKKRMAMLIKQQATGVCQRASYAVLLPKSRKRLPIFGELSSAKTTVYSWKVSMQSMCLRLDRCCSHNSPTEQLSRIVRKTTWCSPLVWLLGGAVLIGAMAALPATAQSNAAQNDVDNSSFGGLWFVTKVPYNPASVMWGMPMPDTNFATGFEWYIEFNGQYLSITRDEQKLMPEQIRYGQGVLSFRTVEYVSYTGLMRLIVGAETQTVITAYELHLDGPDHINGAYSEERQTPTYQGMTTAATMGTIEMHRRIVSPPR